MPSSPHKNLIHAKFCRRMLAIPQSPRQVPRFETDRLRWQIELAQCECGTWEDPEENDWPAEVKARRDELTRAIWNMPEPHGRKVTGRAWTRYSDRLDQLKAELRAIEREWGGAPRAA